MENSELSLPVNIEYERALLGHAMDRPEWLDLVLSDCPSECFSLDSHRRIWNVLRSMRDGGTPVDIATVLAELQSSRYRRRWAVLGTSATSLLGCKA